MYAYADTHMLQAAKFTTDTTLSIYALYFHFNNDPSSLLGR